MIKSKIKFNNLSQYFLVFILLSIILLLVLFPTISINAFFEGILIWGTKVLPSLLPFFILTKLLSYTNFIPTIGKKLSPITYKLYGVGGVSGYVYLMSIISGYPVGAKLTADLYSNNIITKTQAHTITSFTSTSGPLFILGTVCIGLFNNTKMGIVILISHYISAIINGLIYKHKKSFTLNLNTTKPQNNYLNESMTSSIISIMTVGGFIAIFYMIIQLLLKLQLFLPITYLLEKVGINQNISTSIIAGIFEVTTGCILLSKCNISIFIYSLILSFLISFGGLSIHLQALCFLKNFDLSYRKFLLQKFTHAILSTIITFIILCIV